MLPRPAAAAAPSRSPHHAAGLRCGGVSAVSRQRAAASSERSVWDPVRVVREPRTGAQPHRRSISINADGPWRGMQLQGACIHQQRSVLHIRPAPHRGQTHRGRGAALASGPQRAGAGPSSERPCQRHAVLRQAAAQATTLHDAGAVAWPAPCSASSAPSQMQLRQGAVSSARQEERRACQPQWSARQHTPVQPPCRRERQVPQRARGSGRSPARGPAQGSTCACIWRGPRRGRRLRRAQGLARLPRAPEAERSAAPRRTLSAQPSERSRVQMQHHCQVQRGG
ncbi:hypothetical protein FA09DRAFT_181470 [Tilletiopsis washingtonensis]|uniref:Uncharacterized protein n=1 Tax=Tilletiopsis washingtonensis TaxID=58919 RepID=A0A316ZGC5_9BASI|nr:hypothetical protein FA09DRAFT_181470 [Tilletiopsis washingtonensis]PWO00297.1 hypothetical protein FA09DRAFT_181470 [Tilletiopsis washingtonensis]